ncbi:MAG: hypothetical protein ACON35_07585 [Candidatus Marinamargulisbacteria bacterium]
MVVHLFLIVIRWFGLDTVLCVLAVQLFLQHLVGGISVQYMVGTAMATSLFYMVDRWVDGRIAEDVSSSRHLVYQRHSKWVGACCMVLAGFNMYYWLQFATVIKLRWLVGGCCCGAHLIFLRVKRYRWLKPLVVAAVFSWVMVAGLPVIYMAVYGFIFGLTLLNLCVHSAIETKRPWLPWSCLLCWVMSVGLAIIALPYWWLVTIFGLGPLLYVPLVLYSKRLVYWYELGELIYALPFLVACGLMI